MLILTMAMNIHMSTRFLQLRKNNPELSNFEISFNDNKQNVLANYIYCLNDYLCFFIFIFSEIKPIIDFGWMMTLGLIKSFIITFTLLELF